MKQQIRIYADESVNAAIVKGLKRRGVKIWSARDVGRLGLSDDEQFEYAINEKAAIFTHDDDFLSLAIESEMGVPGAPCKAAHIILLWG